MRVKLFPKVSTLKIRAASPKTCREACSKVGMHAHASEGKLGDGDVFFVLHFPFNTSGGRRVLGSWTRNFSKLNATHSYFWRYRSVPYLWASASVDGRIVLCTGGNRSRDDGIEPLAHRKTCSGLPYLQEKSELRRCLGFSCQFSSLPLGISELVFVDSA